MISRNKLPIVGYALACLAPGLAFLAQNAKEFQGTRGTATLVVLVLCGLMWLPGLVVVAASVGFTNRRAMARTLTVGTVGMYVLFSQQELQSWLLEATSIRLNPFGVVYSLSAGAFLFLIWRLSYHESVRVAFAIAAIIITAIPSGKLVWLATTTHTASAYTSPSSDGHIGSPAQVISARGYRNAYYVIVDEYAGRKALTRSRVDIGPFLDQMRGMGYEHLDSARSNYVTTYLSLMAILQMDYVMTERSGRFPDRLRLFPNGLENGAVPRVVREVRAAGYDFFHVGNALIPCRPRLEVNCLSGANEYGFYWHVANAFLAPTRIPRMLSRLPDSVTKSSDAMAALSASMDSLIRRDRPFLAFVHNMSPHSPYRRADCSTLPDEDRGADEAGIVRREDYGNSIKCVNAEITALASLIHERDPEAIVVFQSDHGSDFDVDWSQPIQSWSDAAINERSDILNLIHVPESCRRWMRPGLSQINTMCLVVGCLQGRRPDYVEDRTYLSTYEKNPDFGLVRDVTDRLRAIH